MKRSHEAIDRRSLLLHRVISSRIQRDPALIGRVNETVAKWLRSRPHSTALAEWRDLLARHNIGGVVRVLRSRGEEAARLRQSSPFAGILTEEERSRIFRRYASA
jgi:hypothetical protein